jgi:deoxycytidylate deaminase
MFGTLVVAWVRLRWAAHIRAATNLPAAALRSRKIRVNVTACIAATTRLLITTGFSNEPTVKGVVIL